MVNYKLTPLKSDKKLVNLNINVGDIIGYKAEGPKATYYLDRVGHTDMYDVMKPSGRGYGGKMNGKSRHKIVGGKLI